MLADKSLAARGWFAAFTAVLVAGVAGRLLFLGDKALWLDEAYSVWFSDQSWRYLWREVPQFETHPPIYYSILKLWRSLGSDEATLRLLSVLANTATIPLVAFVAYTAAPRTYKLPLALAAGFLFATSPQQLEYAQQARPYALLTFASCLMLAAATWIVAHPERAGRGLHRLSREDRPAAIAYLTLGIGMAATMWLHNLGPVYVAVLGFFLMVWWTSQGSCRRSLFWNLLAAAALALALYAPNLPTLLLQAQFVSENFWLKAPSLAKATILIFRIYGQWQWALGGSIPQTLFQVLLAVPLAVMGVVGSCRLYAGAQRHWVLWILLAAALGPLLLMSAITYWGRPVLMERSLIPLQVSWTLLLAAAPLAVARRHAPLVWGMIVVIGLANVMSFVADQATPSLRAEKRPWRVIARHIAESDAPTAPVILVPNSSSLPLEYYETKLNLNLAIHPLPGRYPVRGDLYHYPAGGLGVPAIDEAALRRLELATAWASTVWLIARVEYLFDPALRIQRALSDRYLCAEILDFGSIESITLTRFDLGTDHPAARPCPPS